MIDYTVYGHTVIQEQLCVIAHAECVKSRRPEEELEACERLTKACELGESISPCFGEQQTHQSMLLSMFSVFVMFIHLSSNNLDQIYRKLMNISRNVRKSYTTFECNTAHEF